jgi:L-lactate utilization protein LutC
MRVPICERSAANGPDIVAELVTGGDRPDHNPFAVAAKEDALQRAATQLRARGFKVELLEDGEAARTRIVELVPAGASVYTGTSETLRVSGIDADLNASGRYDAIKPRTYTMDRATQAKEIRRLISSPDVVVGSVAAVTETGSMVAASSTGFQIPAYSAGAGQVILVVGAQKVVPDLDTAMDRVESYVLPLEDARSLAAYGAHSAMNRVLIFNGEPFARVTVLLLRKTIGY